LLDERLEKIISDILEKKPGLTKDELIEMIEKKKASVGSGYLTSVGAAFLVAGDLNLDISRVEKRQYKLKDITPGLNDISVACYFLKTSELREYTKKDGTVSSYRRTLVFDNDIITRVLEWDILKQTNQTQFALGEPIIIKGVSSRIGRDGKVELHANSQSKMVQDNERSPMPLDTITRDISAVNEPGTSLVITGIIEGRPRMISFTKKDGSEGKALQFSLISKIRPDIKRRVVLWLSTNNLERLLDSSMEVRLVDVDARLSTKGEIEFHGSDQTLSEILETDIKAPRTSGENSRFFLMSIGPQIEGQERRTALLSDGTNYYTLTLSGKLMDLLNTATTGDILELKNHTIKDGHIYLTYSMDNVAIVGSDEQYLSHAFCKINAIGNVNHPCVLEAVALSKATERLITTRDGRSLQVTQLILGDETGEIEISGWGIYGNQLTGILPGTRLIIYGAVPARGADGTMRLQCKEYTKVERIAD
jgi:hypothetical protein